MTGSIYLPAFSAATSSQPPFYLSSGSVLSFLVCPCPGASDSACIYTGRENHWKSLYLSVYSQFSRDHNPCFFVLEKVLFSKGHEACTIHQEGNSFTKSHHFSSLALAFYTISGITIMLKGAGHECTPFLSFVLERTPCKELGDSISMYASAIFTWTGHIITLGFSIISTCKTCKLVLHVFKGPSKPRILVCV